MNKFSDDVRKILNTEASQRKQLELKPLKRKQDDIEGPSSKKTKEEFEDVEEEAHKFASFTDRAAERRRNELLLKSEFADNLNRGIEESRYMGGSFETTHMVRGLDYSLLQFLKEDPKIIRETYRKKAESVHQSFINPPEGTSSSESNKVTASSKISAALLLSSSSSSVFAPQPKTLFGRSLLRVLSDEWVPLHENFTTNSKKCYEYACDGISLSKSSINICNNGNKFLFKMDDKPQVITGSISQSNHFNNREDANISQVPKFVLSSIGELIIQSSSNDRTFRKASTKMNVIPRLSSSLERDVDTFFSWCRDNGLLQSSVNCSIKNNLRRPTNLLPSYEVRQAEKKRLRIQKEEEEKRLALQKAVAANIKVDEDNILGDDDDIFGDVGGMIDFHPPAKNALNDNNNINKGSINKMVAEIMNLEGREGLEIVLEGGVIVSAQDEKDLKNRKGAILEEEEEGYEENREDKRKRIKIQRMLAEINSNEKGSGLYFDEDDTVDTKGNESE